MTDVRALLLTDVVGGTELNDRVGDAAMAALWAEHDRVARGLLRLWHGREIDKTDGMLMLFERAADALGYVLDLHRALAGLSTPVRVRAGLHVGPVLLRENTPDDVALGAKPIEVDGIAKPTAARVMAIALGGQTLLTAQARQAIGETPDVALKSQGFWRAKGLAEPFELFEAAEAADAASPSMPPPLSTDKAYRVHHVGGIWLPVDRIAGNLPAERDAFVGRSDALGHLGAAFERGARLLSIVGFGGCGKTRLATHFAWHWLGDFSGGAWFCDLSRARDVDGIVQAVAEALGVPLGGDDPVVQLGHAIAGRDDCLIVLDNFEQVARFAEATLGHWLGRAARARFVVTTREVLGLPGEETYALAPLPSADAQALFMRRARAAASDFDPSPDDRAATAPLVALLDGLPLAIELAAARVRVMAPRMLLDRMSDRFRLLSSGAGRRDRQATLHATVDWSWDLLPEADKSALAQLSVFEGGFTLDAAEQVIDLGGFAPAPWLVDVVQSLVDKSFVRSPGGGRFDLLGTVREYAAAQLRSRGRFGGSGPDAAAAAERRHGQHFAALDERAAIAGRCVELDNLVAACRRAVARGDAEVAVATLTNACAALRLRGPFRAAIELSRQVLDLPPLTAAQRSRAECVCGGMLDTAGRADEALPHLQAALALARQACDRSAEACALSELSQIQRRLDDGEVDGDIEPADATAALRLATEIGDRALQCKLRNVLGNQHIDTGLHDAAAAEYEAALALARELGDRRWECVALGNLANLDAQRGRTQAARAEYEVAIALAREIGGRQWEGNNLCNLGFLLLLQGDANEARQHFEAALLVAREIGHARLECLALGNLGIALDAIGDESAAHGYYEAALAAARDIGDQRSEGQFLGYLGLLHARQGRADDARRDLDGADALLRGLDDRFSLGIVLCGRAEAEWRIGRAEQARRALDEARELALRSGVEATSELGVALQRVEALMATTPAG